MESNLLRVNSHVAIPEGELSESFVRASGPGGQNVNKVATAVQLRFHVRASPSLPEDVRARLQRLAGRRLTSEGVLIIEARRFRTRERNRDDARARLVELVRRACETPKPRRRTRPTLASKRRRLEGKERRSRLKDQRRRTSDD